jgi:hypothetical protein
MGGREGAVGGRAAVGLSLAFFVSATFGACGGPLDNGEPRPTWQLATDGAAVCVTNPFAAGSSAVGNPVARASFPRDPGFEDALPDKILGRPVEHLSFVGDATEVYGPGMVFGLVGATVAKCLGVNSENLTTAVAYSASGDLAGWLVIGVRIHGVPGPVLEAALRGADRGSFPEDEIPAVRTVGGKTYRLYTRGYLPIYTTSDAMYVIVQAGDSSGSTLPSFDKEALFDDVIRQLP